MKSTDLFLCNDLNFGQFICIGDALRHLSYQCKKPKSAAMRNNG